MGIEYRHFLVVNDAQWRPQADTVARVEAVLRQWDVVRECEKVIDLALGANNQLRDVTSITSPGPGIAAVYSGVEGRSVELIAGPSSYEEIGSDDRYIMDTTIVVGEDFRVQCSFDGIYFELVSPAATNGEPFFCDPDEEPYDNLFSQSLSTSDVSAFPEVTIHIEEHAESLIAWEKSLGFWRGAVIIDFGKDLPAFTEEVHALPAREFVEAISAAFRGPLVEIGEFY